MATKLQGIKGVYRAIPDNTRGNTMSNQAVLRVGDAAQLLAHLFRAGLSALVVGKPGGGKSDIIRQAAKAAECDLLVMHPAVSDPTDYKGLPFARGDTAEFLPFGDLKRLIEATKPTVAALEDFGQASIAVQAACMQLLHSATGERRIGDHLIPSCVTFVLTSNRRSDKAGVQGILETVKSRVHTIIEVKTHIDDWTQWAYDSDVAPEVIAFLRTRPELLHKFEASADMTNSPSPRTWAHLNSLFKLGLPSSLRLASFCGAVGDGAGTEFLGFLKIYDSAPSIDAILLDPKHAPIPDREKTDELYAVAVGLAYKATAKNFANISIYAQRLFAARLGEYSTLIVCDSLRRKKGIEKTVAFAEYCMSDAGKGIAEANTDER